MKKVEERMKAFSENLTGLTTLLKEKGFEVNWGEDFRNDDMKQNGFITATKQDDWEFITVHIEIDEGFPPHITVLTCDQRPKRGNNACNIWETGNDLGDCPINFLL